MSDNDNELIHTDDANDLAKLAEEFGWPEVPERDFELEPDEIEGASVDELIEHLEARDRYRFGGLTDGQ